MGVLCSKGRPIMGFSTIGLGHKRLTREQIQMVDKYLPDFRIHEQSTELHRDIAARHWDAVFRDGRNSITRASARDVQYGSTATTATSSEAPRSERHSVGRSLTTTQSGSKIGLLFDAFYAYIDEHSPDLKPLFRSSLRVKGKVLVHISAGMRSILGSQDAVQKMAALNKTHVRFGVQLHNFNAVGKALLHAMEKVSDDAWTPEVADAWRRLFAHCSAILLALQQRAISSKEYSVTRHEQIQVVSQRERPASNTVSINDYHTQS